MSTVTEVGSLYSSQVGFVYVFNLIVGAGVLAMPRAFGDVGWALGIAMLVVLAFMSYVTATMMVEAMAAANAVLFFRRQRKLQQERNAPTERSRLLSYTPAVPDRKMASPGIQSPAIVQPDFAPTDNGGDMADGGEQELAASVYEIKDRVEMGTMAQIFFNKVGVTLYYICICIYLYGDLAIYAVAIPKALVNATCWRLPAGGNASSNSTNSTGNATYSDMYFGDAEYGDGQDQHYTEEGYELGFVHKNRSTTQHYCFGDVTDHRAYWLFLGLFALLLGPFTFFDLQKTKIMQVATTILRWMAFIVMIALAGVHIAKYGHSTNGKSNLDNPADLKGVPSMFGVSIYSFMCQHSLPSLVTPIKKKNKLSLMLFFDFLLVLGFYLLVNFTAVAAFPYDQIEDEYSNNFNSQVAPLVLSYFLRLFPVFVLSTNFPIISITLRNNLKSLFLDPSKSYSFTVERLVFPIAALLPPLVIAFATQDLETLVGYTGSYAGVGVQYLIPIALVYCARRQLPYISGFGYTNQHKSPFFHFGWLWLVLSWSAACIIFNTVNHIIKKS